MFIHYFINPLVLIFQLLKKSTVIPITMCVITSSHAIEYTSSLSGIGLSLDIFAVTSSNNKRKVGIPTR